MAKYYFDTGEVELNKDQERELNSRIQRAAIGFLGEIDFGNPVVVFKPWEWYGGRFINFDHIDHEHLKAADAEFAKRLGGLVMDDPVPVVEG